MTRHQDNLFDAPAIESLADQFTRLSRFSNSDALLAQITELIKVSPLRHMQVPGGKTMSVAMSNCGPLGWVSDVSGYRYSAIDPLSGQSWPDMPAEFLTLATQAATLAGFEHFAPDACLINCYRDRAQLGLHRDADENDMRQPIVSVSIGDSARFFIGGLTRRDPIRSLLVHDADVLVWGGRSRLIYHKVSAPKSATASRPGLRWNLTFRKAD